MLRSIMVYRVRGRAYGAELAKLALGASFSVAALPG